MKPPRFEYFDPRTLEETLALLAEHGDAGKVLAGGQSLVPMLNFRLLSPACLIDINHVEELSGIDAVNGGLTIGALTRQRSLEKSSEVRRACPLIDEVMPSIAHFQIRNRGTLGGSLSHADPAAELPAVVTVLKGRLVLTSKRGRRVVEASDFFTGYLTTCLEPDELLTQILLPAEPASAGSAFLEVTRRHGDFALVGVAVVLALNDNEECVSARIVLTGVAQTPFQATKAANALLGCKLDKRSIEEAAQLVAGGLEPQSDLHASAAYRSHAAQVLTARAVTKAAQRARAALGAAA